jgi:hypothetical protein
LTLQPLTPTQAIQIGGSDSGNSGILSLTGTKLSLLQNGFTSIAIGRADGSGAITLAGDVTFNDPVTLRSLIAQVQSTTQVVLFAALITLALPCWLMGTSLLAILLPIPALQLLAIQEPLVVAILTLQAIQLGGESL